MNEYLIVIVDDEQDFRERLLRQVKNGLQAYTADGNIPDIKWSLEEASSFADLEYLSELKSFSQTAKKANGSHLCIILDHKFDVIGGEDGIYIAKWLQNKYLPILILDGNDC